MAKKESYFKRIKKPINSIEEAKPIRRQTRIYFLISLACFVGFCLLSGVVESMSTVFKIIGICSFIPTAYFALILYAMKRSLKRFKNLHCECGAQLVNDENTSWKEVNRHWRDSNTSGRAESKLYVTVEIACKCPKCGKLKVFRETLCSGKISVSNSSLDDSVVSTQSLIDDYFAGLVHA